MSTSFSPRTREHTFTSGRTAVLRESVSYMWVTTRMAEADPDAAMAFQSWAQTGEVDPTAPDALRHALQMNNVLVQEMFVLPRVVLPDDETPEDGVEGVDWVRIQDLMDSEMAETIELASLEVRHAAGFPGDAGGGGGDADGVVLADEPKPRAGGKSGKRGGGARRS